MKTKEKIKKKRLLRPQVCSSTWPGLFKAFTLASHTASSLSSRGYSMEDSTAVLLSANPINLWISFDHGMVWIDQDYFIPGIFSILSYPVRIENNQIFIFFLRSFFGNKLVIFP